MVLKYLALATVTYGLQLFLSISQIILCLYLIINGILHLSPNKILGKKALMLGFIINENVQQKPWMIGLLFITGIAQIMPLFGLSYWIAVAACPVAIYCILVLASGQSDPKSISKQGNVARSIISCAAILVFGFTIWEGKDLIYTGFNVSYKAAYWKSLEVGGWQKENNPNAPKAGDIAPDFELLDYKGENKVRLSDFRGKKPVVLVFGSFT